MSNWLILIVSGRKLSRWAFRSLRGIPFCPRPILADSGRKGKELTTMVRLLYYSSIVSVIVYVAQFICVCVCMHVLLLGWGALPLIISQSSVVHTHFHIKGDGVWLHSSISTFPEWFCTRCGSMIGSNVCNYYYYFLFITLILETVFFFNLHLIFLIFNAKANKIC